MKSAASWIALSAAVVLSACGGANARVSAVPAAPSAGPAGDYPMVLGDPFVVDGVTYTPVDVMNYDSVGYAAIGSGEGVSGSHRTLPLPSYVEVTSLETGRTILVRLTQRGPMQGSDLVSLSAGAWAQLGAGTGARVPVRVRRVNPPEAERALLRAGAQAPARMDTPAGLLAALKRKLGLPAVAPAAMSAMDAATPVAVSTAAGAKPKLPAAPVAKQPTTPNPPEKTPQPKAVPVISQVPPKSEPKTAAVTTKSYFVQVGAYSTKQRAEAAATATGGAVAQIGKLFRVRSGPHKDRGEADRALAKVRGAGYADARVVAAP